jgi:hypothetical protein
MKMDNEFFERVGLLIEQARSHIGRTADLTMCITNYEIGRMIVEKEQGGKSRAAYGKGLLKELSEYLNNRFEKGFSESTLRNMRKFYLAYAPSIQQAMPAELEDGVERSITDMIAANGISQKSQAMLAEFSPFKLSWSHYLIPNPKCMKGGRKMTNRKRDKAIYFFVSEAERDEIYEKMKLLGTSNLSAYMRKMAIDVRTK